MSNSIFKVFPSPSLLLAVDDACVIVDVNDAFLKKVTLQYEIIIGSKILDLFSDKSIKTKVQDLLNLSLLKVIDTKSNDKIEANIFEIWDNTQQVFRQQYWEIENVPLLNDKGEVRHIIQTITDVTEKIELQNSLKAIRSELFENEELLRKAEEISKFGTWELDIDTNGIKWSDGVYRICGYEPQSFVVDYDKGMSVLHPDDRAVALRYVQETIETGKEYRIEKRFVLEDGTVKHIISRANLIKDKQGKPIKIFGVYQDATFEKEQQMALLKAKEGLNKIMDSSLDAICTTDAEGRFIEVSAASFKIWGYHPEELVGVDFMSIVLAEDHDITLQASQAVMSGLETTNFENRNIRKDGRIINMLWSAKWDDTEQIMYCVARDITEKKAIELSSIEKAKQYKNLFENNPSVMFIWDFNSLKIVDCNIEALLLYGYSREEFLSLTILDIRPPEDLPLVYEAVKSEETYGQIHKRLWTHKKKNGDLIKVEVIAHLMYFNEQKVSLVQIIDVTEREAVLQELKENEIKLRTATSIAKLGYWHTTIKENKTYWSDELYAIWGLNKESFVLTYESYLDTIHPKDRKEVEERNRKALIGQECMNMQFRIILPNGSIRWVHVIGKIIKDEQDVAVILEGTVQDITELKQNQLALEESDERYKYVSLATSDAIWDWNIEHRTLYWGEGHQRIFGHISNELTTTLSTWIDHLHIEDKERVVKSIGKAINGQQNIWVEEYRYKKADESYAYVIDKGFTIRDENGKALRMVGAMQDVTVQKEKEQQLKLLESVVVNTHDAVLITQAKLFEQMAPQILYVNEAFTKMTGYLPEEVLGKTPAILHGPNSDKEVIGKMRDSMKRWEACEMSTIFYKKNGEEFWIYSTVFPVADEKGNYTHWISIKRDITEIKKAEETQKQLKQLELSLEKEKEINNLKTRFTSLASHEFRTPIATIVSSIDILDIYVNMIDNEVLKEKIKLQLGKMVFQSNRLTEMLRDILLLERSTGRAEEFQLEKVDIIYLISDIKEQYYSDRTDGRKLDTIFPAEHQAVTTNVSWMNHIISNLVNNAFKYSQNEENPSLQLIFNKDNYLIIIKDYGIGIPEADQQHLFELFFRANNVLYIEGTGLGLAITKEFTEKLGGSIAFTSQEGVGTTFTLKFPY